MTRLTLLRLLIHLCLVTRLLIFFLAIHLKTIWASLVPVDPDDHTKGYIPPTPSDIGKDTTITYTADKQKATVTYVVVGTGTVLHTDNLEVNLK